MTQWTLEHPIMTFISFVLFLMAADNMWGNYMKFKITKQSEENKGE
jgi:hypothetical protein